MAKLRPYPARLLTGNRWPIQEYDLKSGETFVRGDVVTLDANEEVAEVSGADPTPILGIAAGNAADAIRAGKIEVWLAVSGAIFAMQGDNAPTADDINQKYGIVEDGNGVYTVDGTETTQTRVYVHDVDIDQELYFVSFLDAHRQVQA